MSKRYYIYNADVESTSLLALGIFLIVEYFFMKLPWVTEADYVLLLIYIIPYSLLHELIHALAYMAMGVAWNDICFGAALEKGYLYCQCIKEVNKKTALVSLLAPFIILGLITGFVGLYTENVMLSYLSLYNMLGCSSDILMFIAFSGIKEFDYCEFEQTKFYLHAQEALSNRKMRGIKLLEIRDSIKTSPQKKFYISNISKILAVIYCVIAVYYVVVR